MLTPIATLALSLTLSGSAIWLGPKPPQEVKRIVSLAPSMTEVLFALELGEHVVGVTRYATWPEAVKKVPKVGGFIDPDLESIVALKPDLVLAIPTSGGADRIRQMAGLGLSVLVLPAKTTMKRRAVDSKTLRLGRGILICFYLMHLFYEINFLEFLDLSGFQTF